MPIAPSTYYDQVNRQPSRRQVRDETLKAQIAGSTPRTTASTVPARCGWR